jgi:hypothetical protein
MSRVFPAETGQRDESSDGFAGIFFGERLVTPLRSLLPFQRDTSGIAKGTVCVAEIGPDGFDGSGIFFTVKGFEFVAQVSLGLDSYVSPSSVDTPGLVAAKSLRKRE